MPGKEDSKTSLNQYVCYCQRTERRAMWLKEIIERNSKRQCERHARGWTTGHLLGMMKSLDSVPHRMGSQENTCIPVADSF